MTPRLPRSWAWLASTLAATAGAAVAWADHPGPLRPPGTGPVLVGLLAGGLALAVGILGLAIVLALTRKRDTEE